MARWIMGCCLCWSVLGAAGIAQADGGTLRISEQNGVFRITVFTSPAPLRAGPVDVSVLVQDANTGEVRTDERIEVRAWPQGQPHATLRRQATSAVATNKLFQAAQFELPQSGWWHVQITVEGSQRTGRVQFLMKAADPWPRWFSMWPWFTWPLLVILLFAAGKRLSPTSPSARNSVTGHFKTGRSG